MGCDIHLYVEYRRHPSEDGWQAYAGRLNPGRHYSLFAKMANVRGHRGVTPMFEPRGLPSDLGFSSRWDNELYIDDEDPDAENNISSARAAEWVKNGSSLYVDDGKRVTHPDHHSHSWMTTDEFGLALTDPEVGTVDARYLATLAAMRQFECSGYAARVVFWFDN